MLRLLAIIEAICLFAAAATYGSGSVLWAFMFMLGAYHWTTAALIGICAAAAVTCIVIAVQILVKPRPNLMIVGMVLSAIACAIVIKLAWV